MGFRHGEPVASTGAKRARRDSGFRIDVLMGPERRIELLREQVRRGLMSTPKRIPSKWMFDERGSALYEEISRLDGYYVTPCETELLQEHAAEISDLARVETLIELGSGRCRKSKILLQAMYDKGLRSFVPFDSWVGALQAAGETLTREFPGLSVNAVVGDIDLHLRFAPQEGRRMVSMLGNALGTFLPYERSQFLLAMRSYLHRGDLVLLGIDLAEDEAHRMELAHNDPSGLNAAFNLNLLRVLNREIGANFVADQFEHSAQYDPVNEWVLVALRSRLAQKVDIDDLNMSVQFEAGEPMWTDVSVKFRRERLESIMAEAGFSLLRWWTHADGRYAMALWSASKANQPS